jgi:hypothetical protein
VSGQTSFDGQPDHLEMLLGILLRGGWGARCVVNVDAISVTAALGVSVKTAVLEGGIVDMDLTEGRLWRCYATVACSRTSCRPVVWGLLLLSGSCA